MPRHRQERGRLRRALRRGSGSRRSVHPGTSASGPGPGPDAGRPGSRGAYGGRFRLLRSLMVTPWFAAGAGIVIAAALAVDSPAALTYGPAGPGVHCTVTGCASPTPGHQPDLATASPGAQLKTPAGAGGTAEASAGRRHGAAADGGVGYHLGYQIVRRWPSGFVAMITLPGDLKPGPWSLHFAYPSAQVNHVWGALWQPSRNGNGGTALGPGQGRGWAPAQPDGRQLVVSATGTPTEPSGCRLDGVSCDFGG